MNTVHFRRTWCAASMILVFAVATSSAAAATPAPSTGATSSTTTSASASSDANPVDFHPGLWRFVLSAHVWGPINKHTVHKECWSQAAPKLTKRQETKKCRLVRAVRHGNTFVVDEQCPSSNGTSHLHFSRTYAGNTATETGTVQLGGITAHLKAHAKRIGICRPKTSH